MLGAGLPALGAIGGAVLLASAQVTPIVSVRAEAAAGEAPIAPGEPSQATLMTELRAGAGLRLRTPRTLFQFGVEPRIAHQTPNLSGLDRPLVLTLATASHSYSIDRRLQWRNELQVSAGEVEYTQAERALSAPIARRIDDPVVVAFSTAASSSLVWQKSRRYELSFGPSVESTITDSEADDPSTPSSTTAVGFDFTQSFQTSFNGTLAVPLGYREYFISDREDQRTLSAGLAYSRVLGPRTNLEASVGAVATEGGEQPFAVLPEAGIALQRVVYATRVRTISNRIAARLEAAFDPTQGDVYPTAGIEASLFGNLSGDFRAAFSVAVYTTLTEEPVTEENTDSRAALDVTVGYILTDEVSLDVGLRFGTRASHLSQELELSETTVLGFIALSAAFELVPAEARERGRTRTR